jgi:hypothetical protein
MITRESKVIHTTSTSPSGVPPPHWSSCYESAQDTRGSLAGIGLTASGAGGR